MFPSSMWKSAGTANWHIILVGTQSDPWKWQKGLSLPLLWVWQPVCLHNLHSCSSHLHRPRADTFTWQLSQTQLEASGQSMLSVKKAASWWNTLCLTLLVYPNWNFPQAASLVRWMPCIIKKHNTAYIPPYTEASSQHNFHPSCKRLQPLSVNPQNIHLSKLPHQGNTASCSDKPRVRTCHGP